MKAGSAQASAAPLSARKVASSAKFLAQACNMRKKPHMKILAPRYFPMGKRWSKKLVGNAQARNPK